MNSEDASKPLDYGAEASGAASQKSLDCGAETSGATFQQETQMCTVSTDFPADATINLSELLVAPANHNRTAQRSSITSTLSYSAEIQAQRRFLFINRPTSFLLPQITSEPLRISSGNQSPTSIHLMSNEPQSLFLQALTKLNESSISLTVVNNLRTMALSPNESFNKMTTDSKWSELTPPNSLTSAPPSYSFVLRQMAMRRRPRLMGTFIPSPSFIQHTPPPNYAAAFDIYVDNPIPPPPPRAYHFGFTPMPIVCPECGYTGLTLVTSKITICTHLCALILCVFCCWICVPLPYVLKSCKDVYHYCRNCRNFLGMYCPSSPEQTYPAACC